MRRLIFAGSLLALAGCAAPSLTASGQPLRYPLYFQELSARLDSEGKQVVAEAAAYAGAHPFADVSVIGFAHPDVSPQESADIARTRAQVVVDDTSGRRRGGWPHPAEFHGIDVVRLQRARKPPRRNQRARALTGLAQIA